MNGYRILFRVLLDRKWQTVETQMKFHLCPILSNRQFPYRKNSHIDTSLFLTTLPAKKRDKWPRFKPKKLPTGPLLIVCKNQSLNHYKGMTYGMFDEVPLASKGWYHKKSKGDFFTILPTFEHPAFISSKAPELPKTFEELGISKEIIDALEKMEVYNPTVIQAKSIQKLLQGSNLLLTAETGCGKTLAYVIPMMERILSLKKVLPWKVNSPLGIILLPSKELALQVGTVVSKLGSAVGLHCVTLISGEFEDMAKTPDIEVTDVIVTTLGIMIRYMQRNIYSTEICKHLVLDEADVFFDEEFFPDLRRFLSMSKLNLVGIEHSKLWSNCSQLCLTSATAIKSLSEYEETIPVETLEVASTGYLHKVSFHIRQHFMRLNKSQRPGTLLEIIKKNEKKKISTLIFCNRTSTCNFIQKFLDENGVKSVEINGNMFSDDRLKGYTSFKDKNMLTLVCTDCMSRGMDMPWVKQVINYEFPNNISSYIHRCGRVGRLGYDEDCLVTNFVSGKNEIRFVNEIEKAARIGRELTLKLRKVQIENQNLRKKRKFRRRRAR